MNVVHKYTAAIATPLVKIHMDPTRVSARQGLMVMEHIAKVR